jgi:ABC-type phosphate transport system auxiliary subunit
MSNPLKIKVMGNSKWAQTKSGLLSEIESLNAQVESLKLEVSKSALESDMYRRWWVDSKGDASRLEAVVEVLNDHIKTLKSMCNPELISKSEEV